MKFFTVFASLAAVSKVALASYCGSQICDPNSLPNVPLTADIKVVEVSYKVAGKIVIENDCVFTVKGFQLTPGSEEVKWYGSDSPNSSEGIVLSKELVNETPNPTDKSYNIKDTDSFCHASLLKDIGAGGVFRLMDKNNRLIAMATVTAGSAPSTPTSSKSSGSSSGDKKTTSKKTSSSSDNKTTPSKTDSASTPVASNSTVPGNSTAATSTPIINQTQANNKSGAISLKAPSIALYITLFILAFLRF